MANLQKSVPGPAGADGTDGLIGANGAPGSQLLVGAGVPSNGLGINGDFYLNTANNDYYTKAAGTWTNQGQLSQAAVPSGGTQNQALIKLSATDFDVGWGTVIPTGNALAFAGFDPSGDLYSIPSWSFDAVTAGLVFNKTVPVIDDGNQNINSTYIELEPSVASPSATRNIYDIFVRSDPNDTGFSAGTSGQWTRLFTTNFVHESSGNIGETNFHSNNFSIGNGTDPITARGLSYMYGFGAFRSGVDIVGPVQGYGFQPNADAGSTMSAGYVTAFYDAAQFHCAVPGYTSYNASPTIDEIQNNTNYVGYALYPNIPDFTGNSGFFGANISPNLGTFGTGGATFLYINPTVDSVQNATGIYANMSSVSGVNVKAIDVVGDVSIQGDLSFTGNLGIGKLDAFFDTAPVDGGGNPLTIHGMISSMTVPASATTANADAIGVNTAMLITLGANSVSTSGAFGLGFSALALPCVVETHTGATLDFMSAATYAVNLAGTSTGGTIDEVNLARALVIPNGITTINKLRGFYYHEPFGASSSNSHGVYVRDAQNYFEQGLLIGGTPLSDDRITDVSVGLELKSTTKVMLPSRLTTTERDALTAVDGMFLYNSTVGKFQGRAAGSWVDFH